MNGDREDIRRVCKRNAAGQKHGSEYGYVGASNRLWCKTHYVDGQRHGPQVFYDSANVPVRYRSWCAGKLRGPEKEVAVWPFIFRTVRYWLDDELLPVVPPQRPVSRYGARGPAR